MLSEIMSGVRNSMLLKVFRSGLLGWPRIPWSRMRSISQARRPKRNLCSIALALLLISAGAITVARASIIETLKYTGYLDKLAQEHGRTAPDGGPVAAAPAVGESQPAVPFHFILSVEWPEGRIPGDAEDMAPEVMAIFRKAAAAACSAIRDGPGPVAGVTFPTESSIEYWCGPVPESEGLKIAGEAIGEEL